MLLLAAAGQAAQCGAEYSPHRDPAKPAGSNAA